MSDFVCKLLIRIVDSDTVVAEIAVSLAVNGERVEAGACFGAKNLGLDVLRTVDSPSCLKQHGCAVFKMNDACAAVLGVKLVVGAGLSVPSADALGLIVADLVISSGRNARRFGTTHDIPRRVDAVDAYVNDGSAARCLFVGKPAERSATAAYVSDFCKVNVAQLASLGSRLDVLVRCAKASGNSKHKGNAVILDCLLHAACLGKALCHGLFAQNVLFCIGGSDCDVAVAVIPAADIYRVNVCTCYHLFDRAKVLGDAEFLRGGFCELDIEVADSDNLCIGNVFVCGQVRVCSYIACADNADFNFVHRYNPPK